MASTVKPVPEGFHTVTPHLIIRGAAKAIEFYKKAFGAEEIMRMPGPDGQSIMHAEIRIGDCPIMLNDEFPDWGKVSPQALNGSPVTIHLYVNDVDATFNKAVQAGAKAVMPVADMFWGDRYGCLQDPFGHQWSVATHIADYSPEECMKRCQEAMGGACKPS